MRNVSQEATDSPEKLKNILEEQYGDLLPSVDNMEVGYYKQSKKMWIKNRPDINDVWKLVHNGDSVTLWSTQVLKPVEEDQDERRGKNAALKREYVSLQCEQRSPRS